MPADPAADAPLPTRIRVMLVDDHPLVRDGVAARLEATPDIQVVGEAGRADEALRLVRERRPDIVLMDIGMQGVNGIEATALLMAEPRPPIVLMLSMYDKPEFVQRALAAGARGYVLKDAPAGEIVSAIRTAVDGGTYLSAALASRLFQAPATRLQLTEREEEILTLLGQGQSSKQIARVLNIGVRTVDTHRQSIRRKLDLEGPADLIRYAVEHARPGHGAADPGEGAVR